MKKSIYQIALIYAVSGLAWFLLTDQITQFQTGKGLLFVLISTLLITFLIKKPINTLQQKRILLNNILKTLPLPALIIKDQKEVVLLNNLFSTTFGYTDEDLPTMEQLLLTLFPDQHHRGEIQKHFLDQGNTSGEHQFESVLVNKNGDNRSVRCHLMTCEGYLVFIIVDITQYRATSRKNQQLEKLQALGQLAGGIAHDFNNQLMPVLGFAELIKDRSPEHTIQNFASKIIKNARSAATLSRQLLTFSRQSPAHTDVVDIHQLLTELLHLLQHTLDRRIDLKLHCYASNSTISGNSDLLQNAFLNIALNARDAIDGSGTFTITTRSSDQILSILFQDDGKGIPPEITDKIFDPFFTTKAPDHGTGMGLSTVYGTIQKHQGNITVVSAPEKGTTFTITLPLSREAVVTGEITLPEPLNPTPHNILIVDDDPRVVDLLKHLLSGYNTTRFTSPEEAIEYHKKHPDQTHLAIIDLIMPGKNGLELLKILRGETPKLPVIIISGFENHPLLINAALPRQDLLKKPFNRDHLIHLIESKLSPEINPDGENVV